MPCSPRFNAPILSLATLSRMVPIWCYPIWTAFDRSSMDTASRCRYSPNIQMFHDHLRYRPTRVGWIKSEFLIPSVELSAFRLSLFPFRYHIQTFASHTTTPQPPATELTFRPLPVSEIPTNCGSSRIQSTPRTFAICRTSDIGRSQGTEAQMDMGIFCGQAR